MAGARESAVKDQVFSFLNALFGWTASGFIEVRVIVDRKAGVVVERKWYRGAEALDADFDRLLGLAADHDAAVFFGLMPRREIGKGKAKDVLPARLVWADLDIKDYPSGEEEMRGQLARFPLPPTIVVRSGHGLHCYWLLKEEVLPEELSQIANDLRRRLGGDSAFDAARLLRLPGTFNRKDSANPIPVTVETFELERVYDRTEVEDAIAICSWVVPGTDTAGGASAPAGPSAVASVGASERVREVIAKHRKVREFFLGTSKAQKRPDGLHTDCSSSGYDWSFLLALARHGVKDEAELMAALFSRPDGRARAKGARYAERTVRGVLEFLERTEAEEDETPKLDFEVEELRVYPSTPASYELVIGGKPLVVTSPVLRSPGKFQLAFFDRYHRLTKVPKAESWHGIVNGWLADATYVEVPPEASDEVARREEIERIVEDLPVGDDPLDLDRDKGYAHDGQKLFKTATITRALVETGLNTPQNAVCLHLKAMGFAYSVPTLGGKRVRVWGTPWNA